MADSLLKQRLDAALQDGIPLSAEEAFVAILLEAMGESDMNSALRNLLSEKSQAGTPWSAIEGMTELLVSALGPGGAFADLDLSGLPTSDPGNGKPWLNGGVVQVGP